MSKFNYANLKEVGSKRRDEFILRDETGAFDQGICPHCHAYLDAASFINYDISQPRRGLCPACGKDIRIHTSVQYLIEKVKDDE